MRLLPDNINKDNGIEICEAWILTIKKHKGRPVRQQTAMGTTWGRTSHHHHHRHCALKEDQYLQTHPF